MHPGDVNFRDKRLTKMLGVYQDDVNAASQAQNNRRWFHKDEDLESRSKYCRQTILAMNLLSFSHIQL